MPSRNSRASNLFAICCLIATLWTVVATSSSDGSIYGTYRAKSDCVSPVQNLTVSVSGSSITSPASYSFANLGFPNATVAIGETISGTFNGANRICQLTFRSDFGLSDNFLYTCLDNGEFTCNIYLDSY